ncbi:MAG: polymerase sigma-70 factor, subfamily [Candidatus Atribacteria bacterium]|jgi:RNA polymerase sigma-70 factor (ECF subfamily)|uniref:RNA polymerase sigma factor n=1 Tax=Atrimonas thermophila TaxID=3064161 RepID=UPI0024AAC20D|nr:polymerase sigma-70 factor, subfamily [Candidatus Atribacteria bacterium]
MVTFMIPFAKTTDSTAKSCELATAEKLWFEKKIQESQQKVLGFAYYLVGNFDKAQDLAQEAFLRAFKYRKSYNADYPFETWVNSILLNVYRQQLRKEKLLKFLTPNEGLEDQQQETWDIASPQRENIADPEKETMRKLVLGEIKKIIAKLPSGMKEVIILCDLMGYSYEEASNIVKCPIGTIRSRLHRARKKVKKAIENAYGEDVFLFWGD